MGFNLGISEASNRQNPVQAMPSGYNPLLRHLSSGNELGQIFRNQQKAYIDPGNPATYSATNFAGAKMDIVLQHLAQTTDIGINQPIIQSSKDNGAMFKAEQNALLMDSKMTNLQMQTEFQSVMNILG